MSTRIVGGAAKGRRITVPASGTRPTSERARAALFNTLAGVLDLDGARVLDLFAGSGAIGLEALSRGATHATFVESDRRAAHVLAANLAALALPGAQLLRAPVEAVLAGSAGEPFDLVFADPPYALADDAVQALLLRLVDGDWLAPGGIVVIERSARGPALGWPDVIDALKHRRYGEGVLWYGRRATS